MKIENRTMKPVVRIFMFVCEDKIYMVTSIMYSNISLYKHVHTISMFDKINKVFLIVFQALFSSFQYVYNSVKKIV